MINIKELLFIFGIFLFFFQSVDLNAQKINQFDKNKKRTGVWKKYHPNKRIRYQGAFLNGKEVGVFKFYDITSSKFPTAIKRYTPNNDTVFVVHYTLKGRIQSKGKMLLRKRVGKWYYYFENGTILSEENYTNGLLNGTVTNYYPLGTLTEQTDFQKGLKHGVSKKYSSKGVLIEEVSYSKGKLEGLAKYFELNGNLKEKGIYKQGKRFGKWDFYLNGELATDKQRKKSREPFKKQ